MLKKDPLSLFGGGLGASIPSLVRRDTPHLEEHLVGEPFTPEVLKRQLPTTSLPSLSQGIGGVGIGALPLSGVQGKPSPLTNLSLYIDLEPTGVSPDLAYLVGSIAKNIAIPGGNGLGSVTGSILSILNGVVPNFLFQLPVVQDSVPTFGVLQLLSSINPNKFGGLGSLTNLASLQQAASAIPAGDLAFLKTLPLPSDPTNLLTTITTLSDNILTLPGNVSNLKASVAALSLRNLGLSVPGLS